MVWRSYGYSKDAHATGSLGNSAAVDNLILVLRLQYFRSHSSRPMACWGSSAGSDATTPCTSMLLLHSLLFVIVALSSQGTFVTMPMQVGAGEAQDWSRYVDILPILGQAASAPMRRGLASMWVVSSRIQVSCVRTSCCGASPIPLSAKDLILLLLSHIQDLLGIPIRLVWYLQIRLFIIHYILMVIFIKTWN